MVGFGDIYDVVEHILLEKGMKNWKNGANPKKVKYARRKAQSGWRKAQAKYVIRYTPRVAESGPLPSDGVSPTDPNSRGSDQEAKRGVV